MDLRLQADPFEYLENKENMFFLIQYNKSPADFARKVVRFRDFIRNMNAYVSKIKSDEKFSKKFFIREDGITYLASIVFYSENEEEVWRRNVDLQNKCVKMFNASKELRYGFGNMTFKEKNLWFLVMYNAGLTHVFCGKNNVFKIFGKEDVCVKRDHQKQIITAFVKDRGVTYKGILIKFGHSFDSLMECMKAIRYAPEDELIYKLNSLISLNAVMNNLQLKKKLWFLALYNTEGTADFHGKEVLFQIFNHEKVTLKRDLRTQNVLVFVKDQQMKFKAALTKPDFSLDNLMKYMKRIRKMRTEDDLDDEESFEEMVGEDVAHEDRRHNCNLCDVKEIFEQRLAAAYERLINFEKLSRAHGMKRNN